MVFRINSLSGAWHPVFLGTTMKKSLSCTSCGIFVKEITPFWFTLHTCHFLCKELQGISPQVERERESVYICYERIVSLAQGLRSRVQAQLRQFSIWFSICFLPAPPAVIGYLAFAEVQIQGFLKNPVGTLGAHTTFCEETLHQVTTSLEHCSQCLLSAQAAREFAFFFS